MKRIKSPSTPYKYMTTEEFLRTPQANTSQLKNYTIQSELGKGAFGTVFKAIHEPTGIFVAMKQISKELIEQGNMINKVENQVNFMQQFEHPHIIKLYEVIETDQHIYFVLEYAEHGDLYQYIKRRQQLDIEQSRQYFQQIVSAVDYLHRDMQISHRDIKPENILVNKYNSIKLTDFELSSNLTEGDFLKTSCGSYSYASPEIVSGIPYQGEHIDMWSLGVTLFFLLTGQLPFKDQFKLDLYRKIKQASYELPSNLTNQSAITLIKHLLTVKLDKRATITDVTQSEFFKYNLDALLKAQFESQFDLISIQQLLVDQNIVLQQTNECFDISNQIDAQALLQKLHTQKLVSQHVLCFRLLFDNEFENNYNSFKFKVKQLNEKNAANNQKTGSVLISDIIGTKHIFNNANYATFAEQETDTTKIQEIRADKNFMKQAFYFGINICPVNQIQPTQLMINLLNLLKQNNFQWMMGIIKMGRAFNDKQQQMKPTLKIEKSNNSFSFCICKKLNQTRLEHELIIQCSLYVTNTRNELYYILDLRRVVGEVTLFMYTCQDIYKVIEKIFKQT